MPKVNLDNVINPEDAPETTPTKAKMTVVSGERIWKAYDGRTCTRRPRSRVDQTNGEYAMTQDHFKKACEDAGIPPTARQASKFRLGKGLAFANHRRLAAAA